MERWASMKSDSRRERDVRADYANGADGAEQRERQYDDRHGESEGDGDGDDYDEAGQHQQRIHEALEYQVNQPSVVGGYDADEGAD